MHPQSTDGLSAQVALLQSPILSAAGAHYPFEPHHGQQDKNNQLKRTLTGLTAVLIAGRAPQPLS